MLRVLEQVDRFAAHRLPVLVLGETGTGKELIAQRLHAMSGRTGPLVTVNCAGLQGEESVRSELFGHVRGSFTGAISAREGAFRRAQGGTLFLDELGDLPLDTQKQLLRALESLRVKPLGSDAEVEVDVRIVAATNRDLDTSLREGHFREALYFRLKKFCVHLPALRERTDLEELALHFARRESGDPNLVLTPDVIGALRAHPFPGNVRELRSTMEVAVAFAGPGSEILPEHLQLEAAEVSASRDPRQDDLDGVSILDKTLAEIEDEVIIKTIERLGSKAAAGRALGLSEATMTRFKPWRRRGPARAPRHRR